MSKVKVVGIAETQGNFEGRPFHSVKFHISEPFNPNGNTENKKCYGMETSIQSVKFDNLPFVLDRPMRMDELVTYIGSEAEFLYDKNGVVSKISFLADNYETATKK